MENQTRRRSGPYAAPPVKYQPVHANATESESVRMLNFSPWALLPPAFSICTALGLWIIYAMAVHHDTVVPLGSDYIRKANSTRYPPFISVTGNFPPASCYFSQVMNMAAFGGFVICVLRHYQLRNRLSKAWLSWTGLVLFSIACFGMTLVGNFQLFVQMMIHNVGTLMTFGLGTLYCWLESYITLKVDLMGEGRKVGLLRFLLSGLITFCFILEYTLIMFSTMRAAQCQWALVMFFLIFIGTFGIDFRHSHFGIVCSSGGSRERPTSRPELFEELEQTPEQG